MFLRIKFLFVILAFLLALSSVAQAEGIKIGFVNMNRLFSESPQANRAMEGLQEEFAPRQREVVALQTKLQERQDKIQRDLEVMGPEERRNAERDLRRDERELTRSQQEFQEDVNLRRNESLGKLQRELLIQVQGYAKELGYDLVVSEGVLYASPALEITEQVLSGLKASYVEQPAGN
ncbi:MAG: OmpH family outer membrane protein [Gammaproteobacteria bacterium]|jgi:outer membrane protein|nr:OmpH family outer membrane protein [Gammaproteobacteria bacterium]MDP7152963.1 OmpH family outer membrane protein [Gammaproteobacteria bacterium]MDP7419494.1 OmpH family outer membrane protein [Gammaproteobacteria bacterium]MDP7660458.1 OmpH family outer membrane protein [Gammaproteobacteria bacterium]HJP38432.1 OmpH family outer membrane protein [Gammaproteobacteria bacterium]